MSLDDFSCGNWINGIPHMYRINLRYFEAMPMNLSEEINNFSAKNINVKQKFILSYGFATVGPSGICLKGTELL